MRNFSDILQDMRFGTLQEDLTKKLKEVVDACIETGKVGQLQLTIKLKPGTGGDITITDVIKATIPELPAASTIMYATPEGNLQRQDPRQMVLENIKELGREDLPLKQI